jgi:hypothetical protein
MSRLVHVVGVYALPATLQVTPSCFTKSFQARIGSLKVKITLPQLQWTGDEPRITAPPMDPAVQQSLRHFIHDPAVPHYWGSVSGYHPSKRKIIRAHLGAILLEFKHDPAMITYSDYLYRRGHPESAEIQGLFETIDTWFEQIRTWVETAIDQDADPFHSVLAPTLQAPGLQVLTIDGNMVSIPSSASHITVTLSSFEPISLSLLGTIMTLVNAGTIPSDAHLLLRDSRAEFRHGRYRRSVIDAGSATEITLADFNYRVTHVNTPPQGATLGWYTNQPGIAAQAQLPPNIFADLVDIRNRAIHQNRIPTQAEARIAFALAKQVVDGLDPLPL